MVCQQPFRRESDIFGLSMFVLHGEMEDVVKPKVLSEKYPMSFEDGFSTLQSQNAGVKSLLKTKFPTLPSHQGEKLKMSGVLKSLENRSYSNENSGLSEPISRSGKLVVSGQNHKKPISFRKEVSEFFQFSAC